MTPRAKAYGWNDYTPEMPDEEILRRLLALNLFYQLVETLTSTHKLTSPGVARRLVTFFCFAKRK